MPRNLTAGAFFLALLALPAGARAQVLPEVHGPLQCGTLLGADTFRPALEAFLSMDRAQRPNMASKTARPPDIGDRQVFKVYIWSSNTWVERTFELRDKTALYHAWVDIGVLAQMTQQELDTIRGAMVSHTPAGSINPGQGVMANNHDLFGVPPNVDGDNVVDFLFYDIDNQNVGGFVHPADLTQGQGGNEKDVLHLDVLQSVSFMPRLIAHEYTHLIHFNYDFDVETFVSEGLAEYAMVVNGYTQDNFNYLEFPTEHKRGLFSWRSIDTQNVGRDYDRGRLFFSYVAERIGPHGTGAMVRNSRKGAPGLDSLLADHGVALSEVIGDFHTANWVFDRSVDPDYGYTRPFSAPLAPIPDTSYDTISARSTPEGSGNAPTLEGGAVNYIHFGELGDLSLSFDAYAAPAVVAVQPGILDDIRTRLAGRLIATRDDDRVVTVDVTPGPGNQVLRGNYRSVVLMATSTSAIKTARYELVASWRVFGTGTGVQDEAIPDALAIRTVFPNPINSAGTALVSLTTPGPLRAVLFDALGREVRLVAQTVLPAGEHPVPVSTDGLPAGAYLLVVEAGGERRVHTLVVSR